MFTEKKAAILLGLCAVLAACDGPPARDLTAPEPESGKFSAAAPNTWATKRNMLAARMALKAATVGNIIYVVGGQSGARVVSRAVEAYNVATNSWSARRPLPSALVAVNGVSVIAGRLYVTGGGNSSGFVRTLFVYNPRDRHLGEEGEHAGAGWLRRARSH